MYCKLTTLNMTVQSNLKTGRIAEINLHGPGNKSMWPRTVKSIAVGFSSHVMPSSRNELSLCCVYRVGQKQDHRFMTIILSNLNRFANFFHWRFFSKFVVKCILNIPPYLACVATPPRETLMSAKRAINDKLGLQGNPRIWHKRPFDRLNRFCMDHGELVHTGCDDALQRTATCCALPHSVWTNYHPYLVQCLEQ